MNVGQTQCNAYGYEYEYERAEQKNKIESVSQILSHGFEFGHVLLSRGLEARGLDGKEG